MRGYKQKIAVVPGAAAGGGRGLFGAGGWGVGGCISGQPGGFLATLFSFVVSRFPIMRKGTREAHIKRLRSEARLPGKLPNHFVPQFLHPKGWL